MLTLVKFLKLFLLFLQVGLRPPDGELTGRATKFYPREALNDGLLACNGHKRWTDRDLPIVAMRPSQVPCKSIVLVTDLRTGRSAWARVLDTGPWGSVMPDGTWVVKRPGDPATRDAIYRGVLDAGPAVSRALDLRSFDRVRVRWWRPGKRSKAPPGRAKPVL